MKEKITISTQIKRQIEAEVAAYNQEHLAPRTNTMITVKFQGRFVHISTSKPGYRDSVMCRMVYNGKIDNFEFEIFKWSSERFDDDIFDMPGIEFFDGTVTGAIKAAQGVYPIH